MHSCQPWRRRRRRARPSRCLALPGRKLFLFQTSTKHEAAGRPPRTKAKRTHQHNARRLLRRQRLPLRNVRTGLRPSTALSACSAKRGCMSRRSNPLTVCLCSELSCLVCDCCAMPRVDAACGIIHSVLITQFKADAHHQPRTKNQGFCKSLILSNRSNAGPLRDCAQYRTSMRDLR